MEEEIYGIDREHAHARAVELIPEEFFWDCSDGLAPFGSDEGDLALAQFRDWRKENPGEPTYAYLKWTIESVSEQDISHYNKAILDDELLQSQIDDEDYDDGQYIFTVDVSVIATGFGQLVDEGRIDEQNKAIIQLAIDRQKRWADLTEDWSSKEEYIERLKVLERALASA